MTFVVPGENFTAAETAFAQETIATAFDGGFVTQANANQIWIIICGVMVFFMHAGFSMLEAGSIRMKNTVNIMFKNVMTICIGAISYFLFGYAFAYGAGNEGKASEAFIGTGNYAMAGIGNDAKDFWFFQFAFCATAATIVSGALAGRVQLGGYFVIATIMTVWVYPVISHWVWATGWLSAFIDRDAVLFPEACGMLDYAGSGVVHMTGGIAAIFGAKILGPRTGRFVNGEVQPLPPHNVSLTTLGTLILWFGWYGFNCGSTLAWDGINASKVAVTTTLSPAAAALTGMVLGRLVSGSWDLSNTLNCVLAGLVSITAGCSTIPDGLALVVGAIGAVVYMLSSKLMLLLKIDDPLDAGSVHGTVGIWGCLAVGIFASPTEIDTAYGCADADMGAQFVTQLVGVVAIIAWVGFWSIISFVALSKAGWLRVPAEVEEAGLDVSEHGAKAFDLDFTDKEKGGAVAA